MYGPCTLLERVELYGIEQEDDFVGADAARILAIMNGFQFAISDLDAWGVHSVWEDPRISGSTWPVPTEYDRALQVAKVLSGVEPQRVSRVPKAVAQYADGGASDRGSPSMLENARALETTCVPAFPCLGPSMGGRGPVDVDVVGRRDTHRDRAFFSGTGTAPIDSDSTLYRDMYSCTKKEQGRLRPCLHLRKHVLPMKVVFGAESSRRWLNRWTRLLPSWADTHDKACWPDPRPQSQNVRVLPSTSTSPSQVAKVSDAVGLDHGSCRHGRCPWSQNVQVQPGTSNSPSQVKAAGLRLQQCAGCHRLPPCCREVDTVSEPTAVDSAQALQAQGAVSSLIARVPDVKVQGRPYFEAVLPSVVHQSDEQSTPDSLMHPRQNAFGWKLPALPPVTPLLADPDLSCRT